MRLSTQACEAMIVFWLSFCRYTAGSSVARAVAGSQIAVHQTLSVAVRKSDQVSHSSWIP